MYKERLELVPVQSLKDVLRICRELGPNLCEADVTELEGLGIKADEHSMYKFLKASSMTCYYKEIKTDTIIGVFGFVEKTHIAWMLTNGGLKDHGKEFLRRSKLLVDHMGNTRMNYMFNYVWDGHKVAMRWLKYLGFHEIPLAYPLDYCATLRYLKMERYNDRL